ncbi:hypothetical protein GOEFS_014_00450 [Gordonia effusa NBRC 100432]|uniref:Uncharacterized protein n=1 Tax=Gordonia effusa NBRC 100432 TaxID=1077974 RepID=H0QVF2_9ACTN|nr:hypothetical protein GOEFS_014_00450 [Gordonia effusa NBRC 100432]
MAPIHINDHELYDYDVVLRLIDTRILTVAGTFVHEDGRREYEFLAGALPLSLYDGGFGYSRDPVEVGDSDDLIYLGSFAVTNALPLPEGLFGHCAEIRLVAEVEVPSDAIVVGEDGKPTAIETLGERDFPDLPLAIFS